MQVENYSERAVAIFGDTKPFKDQLLALGGKFNENLRRGEEKTPGWIFPVKRKEELERFISTTTASVSVVSARKPVVVKREPRDSKPGRKELLLRIERLETELECLKQIILKESDSEAEEEPAPEPDTPRPQVRLLRGK